MFTNQNIEILKKKQLKMFMTAKEVRIGYFRKAKQEMARSAKGPESACCLPSVVQ